MRKILSIVAGVLTVVLMCGAFANLTTWSSNAPMAQHNFNGDQSRYIRNNEWGCGAEGSNCTSQTIWANSYSNFGVNTNQPAGITAVLSYPDRQDLVYKPISKFGEIYSYFNTSEPFSTKYDYESAFDIWVQNSGVMNSSNDYGWNNDTEIMIWEYNDNQTPAGHKVGTITIHNTSYVLWRYGAPGASNATYTLVRKTPMKIGTEHILRVLNWLKAHHYISSNAADLDIEFGWEVCSTNSQRITLKATQYSLTMK